MNLVLLCKNHNHAKVVDLLMAFQEEGLRMRGIVALASPRVFPSIKVMARKLHERSCLRRHSARRAQELRHGVLPELEFSLSHNGGESPAQEKGGEKLPARGKTAGPPAATIAAHARQHQIALTVVNDLNGPSCAQALRALEPGLMILGGVPIVREPILAIPQIGTLNVHMGWLPDMRGMNVAEWSIYRDVPVAVSVHFVDAGVDTGAILHRERCDVSFRRGLEEMRVQLSAFQHRVLARAARLLLEGRLQAIPQKPEQGKQYYAMHPRLRALVENKLRAGYGNPV